MSSRLKIAALPINIAWSDRDENLIETESRLLRLQPGTDIVVLPELFSTGYVQNPEVYTSLAEPSDGPTMQRVAAWAHRFNTAIAGSFLCHTDSNELVNRAFFVEPSGETTFYDKKHLFSLSAEHEIFHPGTSLPPVVRFRGWNVSMIVCYDLRFPVWCRNVGLRYDVMLVPANWPQSRAYAWEQLIKARAIENQSVYVGANRSGEDDYGVYDGLTLIVDAMGKPVSETAPDGSVYATLDKEALTNLRRKFPFANDADTFIIEN